jgi:hypothetical protein
MSPTFLKEKGYKFSIFSNEEERIHIHVYKADKENEKEFKQKYREYIG